MTDAGGGWRWDVALSFAGAQRDYVEQDWTQLERRAALDRAVRERRDYVLPARFDDTPVPGLLSGVVTVDLLGQSPRQFAGVVASKLAALGIAGPSPATRAEGGAVAPIRPEPGRVDRLRVTAGLSPRAGGR